jgi:hypothetical protein
MSSFDSKKISAVLEGYVESGQIAGAVAMAKPILRYGRLCRP